MDAVTVQQHIQRAIGLITVCIEGGIDPCQSLDATKTVAFLIDAQLALEQADEAWVRNRLG